MAQILIRNMDAKSVAGLKARAKRHGRSLQAEARLILTQATSVNFDEARRLSRHWQKKLHGRKIPDTTALVREDRRR
jgi:antitoxin FitA